ncbi:MAG TPA: prolyl oligopeptidase family serine peptidase [Terriglobales bacterium]|nr:prolyl oligopeptidase family serine peptidase [Terriglobales bacterium]
MRNVLRSSLTIFLLSLTALAQAPSVPAPPATPKRPVIDEYQGVKVTDDYRWLENWDDPAVKQWSAAENARTREYFDQLAARPLIRERLKQLAAGESAAYSDLQFRGGTLFAIRYQPPQQQPTLVALRSADDPAGAKVIFDPNAVSAKGSLSVDFYVPSLDGKYVAAALSENGSEDSSAHVFEVATGRQLSDVIPRVNFATAGGSLEWKADGSGFYYTRYPQGNERAPEDANFYQQVYFHKLGAAPQQDTYVIGKDFPRIAEIQLRASADGRWLVAAVANGDGGEVAHYGRDAAGKWTQVTRFEDGIVAAKVGADDELYLLSRKDAPRGQILRLPLTDLNLAHAKVIVPQSSGADSNETARASIENFVPTPGRLYVVDIMGGPSRVRVFDPEGHALAAPPLPPISAIGQVVSIGSGNVLFYTSTYLEPAAWYRFDAATAKTVRTALYETSPVKFDDAEVVRDFATSKDGTRVPVNIIRRKGTRLDGSNPSLLEGYGGYGISSKPYFVGSDSGVWLDQGGVIVFANLRGGAEYGEEWHKAGNLTRKQNVFDDFIACARFLIDQNYTSPARLAILGGSNGGLLMGAAFTQHPALFRAVVSYVGIYDMLRVELDPNGAFNVTEFGTVKDPEQFKALYAYSPYHHVKDGTAYPAILMPTGENDHRVNPMQSRKMTARLQAANRSDHPILLRTTASAGHGFGTALDEQIEQGADVFGFLFDQLGVRYTPAGK